MQTHVLGATQEAYRPRHVRVRSGGDVSALGTACHFLTRAAIRTATEQTNSESQSANTPTCFQEKIVRKRQPVEVEGFAASTDPAFGCSQMRCFSGLRFVFLRKTVAILLRHSAAAKSLFGITMENNYRFAPASFCSQMRFRVRSVCERQAAFFLGHWPAAMSAIRMPTGLPGNKSLTTTAQSAGKCWGSVVTHFRENQSHSKKNVF